MIAVSGILTAGGVGVALGFRDKLREMWLGLVEWEGKRGRLTVGSGSSLAVLGSIGVLSLSFLGGSLATMGGLGGIFTAPAVSSSAVIMFASDWGTATGTSTNAVFDSSATTPWTEAYGSGGEVVVAATEGYGDFPTTNILKVPNVGCCVHVNRSSGYIDSLVVGDSIFVRMYQAYFVNGGTGGTHGNYFREGGSGLGSWGPQITGWNMVTKGATTYDLRISANASSGGPGLDRYYGVSTQFALDTGTVYRHEIKVNRTGTTTYKLGGRLYNAADSLLASSDSAGDFLGENYSIVLADTTFVATAAEFNSLMGFWVGIEGANGTADPSMYLGGIAICKVTWCGAYVAGEAGN